MSLTAAELLESAFQNMYDLTEEIKDILYECNGLCDALEVTSLSLTIHQCNKLLEDWISLRK